MAAGLNIDSIKATLKARRGKAIAAIFEIKAVLEDIRMGALGGMDLWELAVVPMLLYTWTDIYDEVIEELENIQLQFLRVLFEVPVSTPKPILSWDTATLSMETK